MKEWRDKSGNLIVPNDCEKIQVELWRAEVQDTEKEPFVNVDLAITRYNGSNSFINKTFTVRRNSNVTLVLKSVKKISIDGQELLAEEMEDNVYTYRFSVEDDCSISGDGDHETDLRSIKFVYSGTDGMKNDTLIATQTLKKADAETGSKWTGAFENLSKTGTRDGKPVTYVYYVREKGCPDHYLAIYENNNGIPGGTITVVNKDVDVESTKLTVRKKWKDLNDQEITSSEDIKVDKIHFNLYQAEADPGITVKFDIISNWGGSKINSGGMNCILVDPTESLSFTLERKEGQGPDIENALKAANPDIDIESEVLERNKKYKFIVRNIDHNVTIKYKIEDHAENWTLSVDPYKKTEAVLSNPILYRENVEVKPDQNGDWHYEFTNLPKSKNDNGNMTYYMYYVQEIPVPGYTSTIENNNGTDSGEITITNKKEEKPKETSLTIVKQWQTSDGGNKGTVEGTVEFRLKQMNMALPKAERKWVKYPSEESDKLYTITKPETDKLWQITIPDLPLSGKDENGNKYEYVYTVEEVSVNGKTPTDDYTVIYPEGHEQGVSGGDFTIINREKQTYVLPETGGPGTKLYTLGGILLTAIASLLIGIKNKRRKEEQGFF